MIEFVELRDDLNYYLYPSTILLGMAYENANMMKSYGVEKYED